MALLYPSLVCLAPPKFTTRCFSSHHQNPMDRIAGRKLLEFPHLCAPHRDLMVSLISTLENRIDSHLLPVDIPSEVEFYRSEIVADSEGSLCIRQGINDSSSHIDFVLASWLHLKQPKGGDDSLNITNLQVYLKPTTNAPHFQFELVQCNPKFLIFFLDLIPRKDIVLNPDYLNTFYENNNLEPLRKKLQQSVPESQPFFSSSLYFRKVISPTGILVTIKSDDAARVEEIIGENIGPIANEVLGLWMENLSGVTVTVTVEENERIELEKRDKLIKYKAIEMDLSSSMPLQFGEQVASRVLGVIRSVFNV